MNNKIYAACFSLLMLTAISAGAQVYKAADSVKLNNEIIAVTNDITNLNAKLAVAQNNLPGYRSRAQAADVDAKTAADQSTEQAGKASGGDVKDARKAKREARKAYREAKDARKANHNVGDQDKKIASLKGELARKQERLDQLNAMRMANAAAPVGQ
ncbi:MAG: hypothetical protein EOO11_06545 [Chitinophagaceae bacterium]|nr:MAG: hypothetical protein EOO11_06545 [Chitinophagaceae bacterium]